MVLETTGLGAGGSSCPISHLLTTCSNFALWKPPATAQPVCRPFVRTLFEHPSESCFSVRAMTNTTKHGTDGQHVRNEDSAVHDVHHLPQPGHSLAHRYRATCADELALISTFHRHPVAARSLHPGALDHTITLPDTDAVTATVRTHRLRVPAGLVRDLSLRYPEYFLLGGNPVYLFTVSIRVGLHDDHPTASTRHAHARAIAEALHDARDAENIHANGTDPATGTLRFSWIGDREGRVFTSPPELFSPRHRAA